MTFPIPGADGGGGSRSLVGRVDVVSGDPETPSLALTGLDGNGDKLYKLSYRLVRSSGTFNVSLTVNGDTAARYNNQTLTAVGGTVAPSQNLGLTGAPIGSLNSSFQTVSGEMLIHAENVANIITMEHKQFRRNISSLMQMLDEVIAVDPTNPSALGNVVSLEVTASAAGFGPGSYLILEKIG